MVFLSIGELVDSNLLVLSCTSPENGLYMAFIGPFLHGFLFLS